MGGGWIVAAIDLIAREAILFSMVGFFVGGLDDLAIDLTWLVSRIGRASRTLPRTLASCDPRPQRRIAVFIAAWDEASVIAAMLATALDRFDHDDYRLYVGTYPNDPATIAAVAGVAARDRRVRLVIGSHAGPTTKADCLNTVWRALARDEAVDGRTAAAIVLHDAEDLVHHGELRVFDTLIGPYSVVQLPIRPLVDRSARLVSGHYADEFAESHGKQLVVRQLLGAGMPLAGVGCAIERGMIERIAAARGGHPFDAASLTEDYEFGLQVAALGGRGILAQVRESETGPLIAVRAYFPSTSASAVRQKARWMTGIALSGWDRLGWGPVRDWRDHWMRMRDRRAPLAVLVVAAAYLGLATGIASRLGHLLLASPAPYLAAGTGWLPGVNAALLVWRLAMRALFTGRAYGWREGCWSLPRAFVANYIALFAVRRALAGYVGSLFGVALRWEKTAHVFPDLSGPPA